MPRYTVELDGRRVVLEGDRPPIEQEVRRLLGSRSSLSPVDQTEARITSRTSLLPQVARDVTAVPRGILSVLAPLQEGQTRMDRVSQAMKDIGRSGLQRGLHQLGLAQEMGESLSAAPAVSIQAKRPVARDLLSVLKGQRVVERGDIARNVGVPEPLSAMFGLAT